MYILFTNNCQKLDPEIFLESAKFYDFHIYVDSSVKSPHILFFIFFNRSIEKLLFYFIML